MAGVIFRNLQGHSVSNQPQLTDASLLEGKGRELKGMGNGKEVSAKARAESVEEVESFFAEIDLTKQDAEWFWLKHEENGWTRAQGKQKVKDWKLHARSWKSKGGIFPSQDNQFHGGARNGQLSMPIDHKGEMHRKYGQNTIKLNGE
jgi:hypothetical protein